MVLEKYVHDTTTNMFTNETETIYANILQSILKIWWKPVVSYASDAIVIQFWIKMPRAFWKSINIPKAKLLLSSYCLILSAACRIFLSKSKLHITIVAYPRIPSSNNQPRHDNRAPCYDTIQVNKVIQQIHLELIQEYNLGLGHCQCNKPSMT